MEASLQKAGRSNVIPFEVRCQKRDRSDPPKAIPPDTRSQRRAAFIAAIVVHGLVGWLISLAVSHQNERTPQTPVMVELVSELPSALPAAPAAAPKASPPPQPKPKAEPKQKAEPKRVPKAAAKPAIKPVAKPAATPVKPLPKPDIAFAEKQEKERLMQELEADKRREEAALAAKQAEEKRLAEEKAAHEAEARADAERLRAGEAELGKYHQRIIDHIRGKMTPPPGLTGKPVAVFDVLVDIPSGKVIGVHQVRSSGVPAYDEAARLAIERASPLPMPKERPQLMHHFRRLSPLSVELKP